MIKKLGSIFEDTLNYAMFMRVVNTTGMRKSLSREIKVTTLDIKRASKYICINEKLVKSHLYTKEVMDKFPMSLSIIGKCLAEDLDQSIYELAARMAQYNTYHGIDNFKYLNTLCEAFPDGLYLNISNSPYMNIKNIVLYTR